MRARCFHLPVLGAVCGVALLAGCSFAPKYSRPTVLTAEGFRDSVALALPDSTIRIAFLAASPISMMRPIWT